MQLSDLTAATLLDEDRQTVRNGKDITIILTAEDIGSTVSEAEKAAVASQTGSRKVGQYFDLSLYKEVNGGRSQITQTDGALRLVITVPDKLKNAEAKLPGDFVTVRVHNGDAVILEDLDSEEGTVTIDTDRFSTYAFAYTEKKPVKSEKDPDDTENISAASSNADHQADAGYVEIVQNGAVPEGQRDGEPKTGQTSHVELYATIALIGGLSYLMLMFAERHGIAEEQKNEWISRLIRWAKRGGKLRRLPALAAIFILLAYYHSIGKQVSADQARIYRE